jgi:hypothetical protein
MDSDTKGLVSIFAIGMICFLIAFCVETFKPQPSPTPPKIRAVQVGYDLDKVGKDSVLIVKGVFVRQVGDRVYVKVK